MTLDERRRRWAEQSAALAVMDDEELRGLVDDVRTGGWGASSSATLPDGSSVFVKRLPLTELEHGRAHSTRNHFRLPILYQYGVGSAGFGVWRELATHVKTTGWVLDGSWPGFPLLVHHRVMSRSPQGHSPGSFVEGPEYIRYWNGSKRIGAYIEARRTAPFELWLVLEHAPRPLFEWLRDHQPAAGDVAERLVATVRFLHDRGVFHFDAHDGNVVMGGADGSTPLLTDFGLANDRAFALSADEQAFLDRHQHYDFGEAIYGIGDVLLGMLGTLPNVEAGQLLERLGADPSIGHDAILDVLVTNVERIASEGLLGVSAAYADVLCRYRPVILFMSAFFGAMRVNRRKNTFFDDGLLAELLAQAGVTIG